MREGSLRSESVALWDALNGPGVRLALGVELIHLLILPPEHEHDRGSGCMNKEKGGKGGVRKSDRVSASNVILFNWSE